MLHDATFHIFTTLRLLPDFSCSDAGSSHDEKSPEHSNGRTGRGTLLIQRLTALTNGQPYIFNQTRQRRVALVKTSSIIT